MDGKNLVERLSRIWPALVSAVLYVLIFPQASLSPLSFFFLIPILYALNDPKVGLRRVFWMFWLTGILGQIGKMYWLVYTMNHYGYIPLPVAILVFLLMTATLGCFWGCAGTATYALRKYHNVPLALLLPACWVVMEWSLTWALSGFPWHPVGNSLINMIYLAQFGDVMGVYGLSFVVIFGNVAILNMVLFFKKEREGFPVWQIATLALLIVGLLVYGLWRLPVIEKKLAQGKSIRVGLLQGNIDQLVKWKPGHKKETFEVYHELAAKAAEDGAELIILPETALPYWQQGNRKLGYPIREFAVKNERYALVAYPYKVRPANPTSKRSWNKHNTVMLLNPEGEPLGMVMKHKLVPFGEFLPMADAMLWLKDRIGLKKARITAGFTPSSEYNTIHYPPAGNFGVAICYEVIFPGLVRKICNLGTTFMVTITNDSWFGDTSAPHQHVDQVAMRAIELRRSFARAANTGISCVVDATGRVRNETPTYTRTYVVDSIRTMDFDTVYARIGDAFVYVLILLLGIGAVLAVMKKISSKEKSHV